MAEVSQVSTVPLGRGFGYPFRLSGGGVEPNMPSRPDAQQLVNGIVSGVRFMLTWSRGSAFMKRESGSDANVLLFSNPSLAAADALAEDTVNTLSSVIDYATITSINTRVSREGVTVELTVRPKGATRERNINLTLPPRPTGI